MDLTERISSELWKLFKSEWKVEYYIRKWHDSNGGYDFWENFPIEKDQEDNINLTRTLHGIDGETLIKIAIDLGIETPSFIPLIPTFRNEIKSSYQTASSSFEKSIRQVEEHPDVSIGLANSALESVIKEIIKDENINTKYDKKKTLYGLTIDLLKEFKIFPNSGYPKEIENIGSSLIKVSQNIEQLRSDNTELHGKTNGDYIVDDPMYAYFIVNVVSSIGMFMINYYEKVIKVYTPDEIDEDDIPF